MLKLYRETDMDVIKIMQDYAYPVTGEIHCADDWFHIGIKGTASKEEGLGYHVAFLFRVKVRIITDS